MEPTLEDTKMSRGDGDLRRMGRKASVTLRAPMQFTERISRKASRGTGFLEIMPALLTRMSRRPWVEETWWTAVSTEVSEVTSI